MRRAHDETSLFALVLRRMALTWSTMSWKERTRSTNQMSRAISLLRFHSQAMGPSFCPTGDFFSSACT